MNPSRRCHPWLSLASLFLLSVGAAAQTRETSTSDVLRGRVINSVTREPVGHALVFSGEDRFATTTDARGNFEFRLPPLQHVTPPGGKVITGIVATNRPTLLQARRPGFLEDQESQVYVDPNIHEVQLTLTPEALIVGRVLLPRSEVAQQVQVQLYKREVQDGRGRWLLSGSTSTRSDGGFRFAGLRAGAYRVMTQESMDRDPLDQSPGGALYGYPPVYFAAAPDFDSSTVLQLTPGKTAAIEIRLEKQPYYAIKIPVEPAIGGLSVKVSRADSGPGFSLGYSEQDNAVEGFLPNGNYTVRTFSFANPASDGLMTLAVNNGPTQQGPLTLAMSRTIPVDVKAELKQLNSDVGWTRVHPLDSHSSPRPWNVNLTLEGAEDGLPPAETRPSQDSKSALLVIHVHPGSYWVRVDSSAGYPAEVTSGGADLLHHPLVVTAGVPSQNIEITLRDMSARLQGVIEGSPASTSPNAEEAASGISKPYAFVYCIPQADGPGQFVQFQASHDGKLDSPILAPGVYRILAFKREQRELEYRNPEAMRAYESKGIVVRLVEDQTETVRIPLIDPGEPR